MREEFVTYFYCLDCGFSHPDSDENCRSRRLSDMAYRPEKLVEGKEVPQGTIEQTEVTNIIEGCMEDFIKDWESYNKEGSADEKQEAINVCMKNGCTQLIALPSSLETVHPKSTLGRWKRTYGSWPVVGQKVNTIMGDRGFWKVVLS